MSTLDQLVARSRTPGQFVERRSFTLSREKAIEKQREFALRHPRQYLLELVQGAVFAGATYMAVDTSPRALLVAWVGGRTLTARELEGLFDYLFADRADPRWRHVVQLAIGINALCQRAPKLIRIESGDGTRSVRMELDASFHAKIGHSREPIQGTYVYVEYEVGWLARFTSTGPTDEQRLVEEKCLYTPIPILLNGVAPFGYRGTRQIAVFGARALRHFDQDGRRGVVAIHANPGGPTGFRMVVGGVWISTLPLPELATRPLYGVVCDDGLRKTADQSDIVQDASFVRMLHAVQPFATDLMQEIDGAAYRPPPLPPVPDDDRPVETQRRAVVLPEPLPEMVKVLHRHRVPLSEVARTRAVPLFWVIPGQADDLSSVTTDGFPWKVLVLTEGQVLTLHQQLPDLDPLRLTSNADVDFVRRVMDQRSRIRRVSVPVADGVLEVRLHLEGPPPDWGPGLPFCVVGPNGVVEHGGIDGRTLRRSDGRSRELSTACHLPRVSLLLRHRLGHLLDETHLRAALSAAHELAAPPGEPVDGRLLSALLAAAGVPQLVQDGDQVRTEVALPLHWPASLRHAPLLGDRLSLEELLAMLGTDRVVPIDDLNTLLAMDELEKRLGYGHLTHPSLEARPLFGAGRFAERWIWLETPELWGSPALQQVVWVRATFQSRDADPVFRAGPRPFPELAGAARTTATGDRSYDEGWRVLFSGLQRVEAERSWAQYARGPITASRAEGMGRLALVHLASMLPVEDVPLLVPSDGGGRRSLKEIRTHPASRVVARKGVRLAEPWTFALTRDELRAVGERPGLLRYDDAPEVWRSLPDTDRGWLVRHEIHVSGLRGWLGLRVPFDHTTGVLLRTTGALIGLSDIERSVPCHGLLWTEDEAPRLNTEQRRQAQLAGLRLYQQLVDIIDHPQTPERAEAAHRYAVPFVQLVWRRTGELQGTALELARRVEVGDPPWGTLEQWLRTPPHDRPAIRGLEGVDEPTQPPDRLPEVGNRLQARLIDAIGARGLMIILTRNPHAPAGAIAWVESESHRGRVVIGLNSGLPPVRAALESEGPLREVLLLELVRLICRWGADWGMSFDVCRAQEALVGQRYGT